MQKKLLKILEFYSSSQPFLHSSGISHHDTRGKVPGHSFLSLEYYDHYKMRWRNHTRWTLHYKQNDLCPKLFAFNWERLITCRGITSSAEICFLAPKGSRCSPSSIHGPQQKCNKIIDCDCDLLPLQVSL